MTGVNLGRALAATVAAVAVLNTLSALSMPVTDRRPSFLLIVTWLALLSAHATAYGLGDRIRRRFDLPAYAAAQAVILVAIAVSRAPAPITVGAFMAGTAELVVLAGARWGTVRITIGAITLFVLAALITSDLYRAATTGVLLAVTGMIAHALAALIHRPAAVGVERGAQVNPVAQPGGAVNLSPREGDVLRELVSGARNSDIAAKLGISERTVKSHLGSIYQKLGVDSRAAAVAAAVQQKLV